MAYTYTGTQDRISSLKLGSWEHAVTFENSGFFKVNKLNFGAYHFLETALIGDTVLVAISNGEVKWIKEA